MYRVLLLPAALLVIIGNCLASRANPPPGRTGAPGEATCAGCHGGTSQLDGVLMEFSALQYMPGEPIGVTVRIKLDAGTRSGTEGEPNVKALDHPIYTSAYISSKVY